MKKNIIKTVAVSALLTLSAFAFADDWYICVGSFKNEKNAEQFKAKLAEKNIGTFTSEYQKNESEKFYRLLLSEKFDSKEKSLEVKRQLSKNSFIKGLGIKDMWVTDLSSPVVKEVVVEKIVEVVKEVPVEIVKEVVKEVPVPVEVPVEVEKKVEVIKEVPVEVVKEVVVERIIETVRVVPEGELPEETAAQDSAVAPSAETTAPAETK